MNKEDKIDAGVEDSMDASDTPSASQPGNESEPVPSSTAPRKSHPSWLEKAKNRLFNK